MLKSSRRNFGFGGAFTMCLSGIFVAGGSLFLAFAFPCIMDSFSLNFISEHWWSLPRPFIWKRACLFSLSTLVGLISSIVWLAFLSFPMNMSASSFLALASLLNLPNAMPKIESVAVFSASSSASMQLRTELKPLPLHHLRNWSSFFVVDASTLNLTGALHEGISENILQKNNYSSIITKQK